MSENDAGPPPGRGLYCNRTLNLRAIKAIGYDMDYTLVHYRVEDWERRAYEHVRGRLAEKGWPVASLAFDPQLVVRGLIVDTELGNLVKANRFGYVKAAHHGSRPIAYDELRQLYSRTIVDLGEARFKFLNTLFSLSEGCMYAQLVDRLDAGELRPSTGAMLPALPAERPSLGYHDLYQLVRHSIDATHMEGALKAEIIADPERYVDLDDGTVQALLDQHHAGKKLLLITNSEWPYTQAMMSHCFDRYLPKSMSWRELFELTIVAANKPAFWEHGSALLRVIDDRGLLEPHVGPLAPHGCYFGGNAGIVEKHLGLSGDEILYCGDHVYGDVRTAKAALRWRTALILRELEEELVAVEQSRSELEKLAELMEQKERLEWRHYQLRLKLQRKKNGYGPPQDEAIPELQKAMGDLREQLLSLDERIAPIAKTASSLYNPRWGLLMRAGNDKSQLARQIERSADIYTSRVSNFGYATPFIYLRSPRGNLPHDPVPPRAIVQTKQPGEGASS